MERTQINNKNYQQSKWKKKSTKKKNTSIIFPLPEQRYTLKDIDSMVLNTDLPTYKAKAILYKLRFVPKHDGYLMIAERYRDKPTLYIKLQVPFYDEENNKISLSVVDGNGNTYAAYHNRYYGNNEVVERIDNKINYIISALLHTQVIKKEE